jgi:phage portal protein BeeE
MGLFDMFDPRHSDGASVQAVMERSDEKAKAAAKADLISLQYSSMGETGYPSEFTWRELVASYTSWVFTSVDKIAKTVAGAPKRLFMYKEKSSGKVLKCREFKAALRGIEDVSERRRYLKQLANTVDRVEIPEHPLLSLLYDPNPIDTHAMFWQEIVQRLELAGSCGIYKVRGRLGVPAELWVLPTSENGEFKPVPDAKLVISGYVYDDGDVHQRFTTDDAFWLRYPNPKNKFEGMSPLKAQIYPYNIDYYLSRQQYKFYKNNAVTGKHFSTDQKMSQDELDKLWDKIDAKFGGTDKAYKTIVTHSGLKSEDPHNATARDMMIDVIGKYAKDKILSGYGINEGMVGLTENQNKANLDTSRENYLIECVHPRVSMIVECFEKWLVPDFDDRIEFEVDLPEIQQRELDILETNSNLDRFVTTVNEERARKKLDPVAWGDAPFVPFNLTPYGAEKPEPKPGGDAATAVAEEDEDDEKDGKKSYQDKGVKDLLWKKFDLATREAVVAFRKTAEKMLKEQEADVISALEKLGAVVKGNIAGWNAAKVKQWIKEHKEKMDKLNIDRDGWEKRTKELFKPVFIATLVAAGKARMRELSRAKAEFEFDLESNDVVEWIGTKLRKFSSDVTGTTYDEVEAVLRSGFEESKPLSNIAADIREKFDVMANYRAANIARTEAANTWNTGDLEAIRQMDLEDRLKKYWINEPGARDTHAEAGQRYDEDNAIGIDEDFEVGDDTMDVPGAGSLAEENVNCRCTLGYVKI